MELGGGGRKTKDSFEKAGGCARTRLSLSRLGLRRRSQVTAGPGLRVPPPLPPGRAGAAAGFDASRARPGQFLTPWPELRQSLRAPSLPQSQDAECDQHGEGKGSRSGRVPDPGPQGKWGGSGLTLHGPPKSWSPAWTGVEGGRARRAAGCCLSSFGLLGQSQGLLASRLQLE